jgi:signal transduction histidine kinase
MQQTYVRGDRLPGRVYAENEPFWALDAEALMVALPVRAAAATSAGLQAGVAFPVTVQREVIAVLEIFSIRAHPPSEHLTALMHNVSDQIGRVLERERATVRLADLVWREQQELLHTLHDSLGQTLTAVGMLSTGLGNRLPPKSESAEAAAEIGRQAQHALDQVRQLAKKLFPVDVDAKSLMAALRDLASATGSLHKIDVRVEGKAPETLHDGNAATELYRIAQEAVTNAVRHGRAHTITIRLEGLKESTRLTIADDGIGIPDQPRDGAGLGIMRHRAASIGASLSVARGTSSGTIVTCTIRRRPTPGKRPA